MSDDISEMPILPLFEGVSQKNETFPALPDMNYISRIKKNMWKILQLIFIGTVYFIYDW